MFRVAPAVVASVLLLSACAGNHPPNPNNIVTTVCADLAPLQPLVSTLETLPINPAVTTALNIAQSLEQGACLNPQQLQDIINQINAVIAHVRLQQLNGTMPSARRAG